MALKVCMFVYNNMKHDSRVLKEAKTLAGAGYDIRVIAVLDEKTAPYEEQDGFKIIRVIKKPLHYKILQGVRNFGLAKFLRRFVHVILKRPLISANRALCLLFRPFAKSRHAKTKSRSTPSVYYWLFGKLKQTFRDIHHGTTEKGAKEYCKYIIQDSPCYFFTVGWAFLLCYYTYRHARKSFYWIVRRPSRIIWFRYIKKSFYWGLRRPLRIIWARYIKKSFYWGVRRPSRIIWARYIKRSFYSGERAIKNFFYHRLKAILMTFHRPLCFLDYYYRSFRLVRNEPADIYHAHDLNTLPVAYWAKKRMSGKLVYDSHELFTETSTLSNIERVLAKVSEKYLIRRADRIITVNESIANELSKRYGIIPPAVIMNCPVINNRLNKAENNLLRQALRIDKETPIILYHGGFAPNRGLQNLVISGNYLDKGIIVFMGWGKLEQELKDLVLAAGLGDKVQFAKPVPQRELLNYATSATLGVIPYQFIGLNNYYTTPNKLFEYIAAGLPVVGSNFPELSKVIKKWNLGKTFNPDDPKDITVAIDYVLSDRDRYNEMKRNVLQAAKVFNWENESKKLLEIYRRL